MIEITNLTLYHDSGQKKVEAALQNITVSLRPGESVGIMGANGSGKTTLARCLNGLLLPTEGEVHVDGLNTKNTADLQVIRRRVGMVFQNPENQIVATTVEREIAFGLENIGVSHDAMQEIVDRMLRLMRLEAYRHHEPHTLSGGEMQRLALAAILALSPQYLVFDEPTSLLDPEGRRRVLEIILSFRTPSENFAKPITPILITQYPEETLLLDRLLVLHRGRVVLDGKPAEIFRRVAELRDYGVAVPVEFAVQKLLESFSNGEQTLNTSEFLPIQ